MIVIIKSDLLESRGNAWNFQNKNERIYTKLVDPNPQEVQFAMIEAFKQYEAMGWSKCYASLPYTCYAKV